MRWKQILGWIFGVFFLAIYIRYFFDWEKSALAFQRLNYQWLAAFCGVFLCSVTLKAVKWTFLIRQRKEILLWRHGFQIIQIAHFVNFAFPIRFGEVLKVIVAKQKCDISFAASTSAALLDRFSYLFVMLICISFAPIAGYQGVAWASRLIPFSLFLILISILLFGTGFRFWKRCKVFFQGKISERLLDYVEKTLEYCQVQTIGVANIVLIFALSVLILGLDALCYLFLLHAFDLSIHVFQAMIAASLMNILFILPSPPGQVGTAEFYPLLIFSIGLALPAEIISTYALIWHGLVSVLLLILGGISMLLLGVRLTKVRNYQS